MVNRAVNAGVRRMIGMREIRVRIWGIRGGNAENRCGNAGNQSENLHIGVEMMNEKYGEV